MPATQQNPTQRVSVRGRARSRATCLDCGEGIGPGGRRYGGHGRCHRCYQRARTAGLTPQPDTRSQAERVLSRHVKLPNGCWAWTGSSSSSTGYGKAKLNGRDLGAHRAFYILMVGPIPEGAQLDHKCRLEICVNPAHLDIVTPSENLLRIPRSAPSVCKNGHALTPENAFRDKRGKRDCRACQRARWQRTAATRRRETSSVPA